LPATGKSFGPEIAILGEPEKQRHHREVHFSPEKEARIDQFATRTGKDTAQVVEEAVDRLLEYETRFIEAVEEDRAAARRGDLLVHNEVVERIEHMFRS
jgi:predicted transcriptional regulator